MFESNAHRNVDIFVCTAYIQFWTQSVLKLCWAISACLIFTMRQSCFTDS